MTGEHAVCLRSIQGTEPRSHPEREGDDSAQSSGWSQQRVVRRLFQVSALAFSMALLAIVVLSFERRTSAWNAVELDEMRWDPASVVVRRPGKLCNLPARLLCDAQY
eukprot:3029317-Rhodomonas_salina.2